MVDYYILESTHRTETGIQNIIITTDGLRLEIVPENHQIGIETIPCREGGTQYLATRIRFNHAATGHMITIEDNSNKYQNKIPTDKQRQEMVKMSISNAKIKGISYQIVHASNNP